jgi:pyridinium-3,5-biscarboxylic acid mononucleotide sulfurtransferase
MSESSGLTALRETVRGFGSALVGYSGGVDSALLAVLLRQELGREHMLAAIGRSASYPITQWQAARDIATRFDIPLLELETHELDDPRYVANPSNRCFFCKTELWSQLVPAARARGFAVVCDGTNADDLHEHRPGYAAGRAAGIRSPLAEAGVTKAQVRAAARELGLPNWDAPAAPCLSSRVQYGVAVTSPRLAQIEQAEAYVRGLGVTGDLRVRHLGAGARVEVGPEWIARLTARLPEISAQLRALGFSAVEIDPRGYRRGSLMLERRATP